MDASNDNLVVGVRFSKVGKVYHFESSDLSDLKIGDMVVVETSRGWQLGQVAQVLENQEPPPEGWKSIDRRATPRDLLLRQLWQQKESEVVENCKSKADDLKLVGIKIVSAEYSFDGSRLTILFSSETEEKYDLKSLRGDMQKMFAPSQVEMRQIGPRDVAKQLCGMGACGLETRCCCSFLTEFSSISIRMAKEQGISLTPSEITGMCGRLRCCLIYEYDQYVDARKNLPKRNKRVTTPQGEGKVVDVVPLREAVLVELPDVGVREFLGSEIIVLDGDGSGKPHEGGGLPTSGTTSQVAVISQPSEIDQVLSGQEISPDLVEGVGDAGSLGPVDNKPAHPARHSQGDGGPRRGEGSRRDSSRQPYRKQPPQAQREGGTQNREQQPGRSSPEKGGGNQSGQGTRREQGGQQNRPQGESPQRRRSPHGKNQGPRPPQSQSQPAADQAIPDSTKDSNVPGSTDRGFRNKRRGRRQHGREDNENRA